MRLWKAQVRIDGRIIETHISANNASDAKALLESQHGKGSIVFGPTEIR